MVVKESISRRSAYNWRIFDLRPKQGSRKHRLLTAQQGPAPSTPAPNFIHPIDKFKETNLACPLQYLL
jgi:hypothetical protein